VGALALRALVLIPINSGSLIPPSGFIDVTDMQPPEKGKTNPRQNECRYF
jgi:hypothetical protein